MEALQKRLDVLVVIWEARHKDRLAKHLGCYRDLGSFEEAIIYASDARESGESEKRNSHQRRLPRGAPKEIRERLSRIAASLAHAPDFESLYQQIKGAIKGVKGVKGVGDLMVYDTSLRLGANLGLAPQKVFLQRGALWGAEILFRLAGTKQKLRSGTSIGREELPADLDALSEDEIENFLCTMRSSFDPTLPLAEPATC